MEGLSELITALAGGIGAARFLQGLVQVVPQRELTVIVNTGDDIELHGLHISPDLDIVMYTLAGIVDEEKGWGVREDTFNFLAVLKKYGYETWFSVGDKDLATHVKRTEMLRNGISLSSVTDTLRRALGVEAKILPMTNDRFTTKIVTEKGMLHFEEYLVKGNAQGTVMNVVFDGANKAGAAPEVVESILNSEVIIVCPSNPIVSIGTILSIKNVRSTLTETNAKIVAISPIVGGRTVKGPADRLMKGLGLEVSAYSVAKLYKDFVDVFIIDFADKTDEKRIRDLGLRVVADYTIMKTSEDKIRLAKTALKAAQ